MSSQSRCAADLRKEHMESVIATYSPMVYRLAYSLVKTRADADDIHQEVFLQYIRREPAFENAEHEKAWFIRVTTNTCRNWWKTAWRRRVVSLSEYEEEDRGIADPSGSGTPQGSGLIDTVRCLPQKYRVVIHLFYYEELSVEEIAACLGLQESAVRTRLTRARKKLGELLKEEI